MNGKVIELLQRLDLTQQGVKEQAQLILFHVFTKLVGSKIQRAIAV